MNTRVKEIWEAGAALYDRIYAGNVPYHRSHEVIVDLLPKGHPVRVLDLGAGTGLLAERILDALPDGVVTCLDFSPAMIAEARRRLARFGHRIAHFGEGSLAFAIPAEEHIAFMRKAGLRASCPWHYMMQAVVLGQKTEGAANTPEPIGAKRASGSA